MGACFFPPAGAYPARQHKESLARLNDSTSELFGTGRGNRRGGDSNADDLLWGNGASLPIPAFFCSMVEDLQCLLLGTNMT